jgi:hypothetical protein
LPISGLNCPLDTNGGRFWRTLATASPGVGTSESQTPTLPKPAGGITKLASPGVSGTSTCPSTSVPPTSAFTLKPPLKHASNSRNLPRG